jgi:acetyl esterase/lipase
MKIRLVIVLCVVLFGQLFISCEDEKRELLPAIDYLDINYGTNPLNNMDIYLPKDRTGNTRTIILIHGGFWYTGDKAELTEYAKHFRDEGFACVTMNYRLTRTSDNYTNPAQINDVGKVIDFMTAKAEQFHISSTKYGLMGVSAGAHIALLYTYASNTNKKVKSVVSVAGPSNFTPGQVTTPAFAQVLSWLIGTTTLQDPGAYIIASPISHVSAQSMPTLLIHGTADNIVPYKQSVDLKAKLDQFNVKNELIPIAGAGHDFTDQAVIDDILDESTTWFDEMIR